MTAEPDHQLLRDSALRWVAASAPSLDGPGRWRAMAGLGWLAITLPEADGGLGQGLAEACVLAEALGTGPIVEPFGPVVLQAAALVARRGAAGQRARWLPAIAEGRQRLVPAVIEPGGHWRARTLRTRAHLDGADWLVSGTKRVVPGGDAADGWLVVAGLGDDGAAPVGFLVPRGTPGVVVTPYATVDGAGACALELQQVRLGAGTRLADLSWDDLDQAADRALVAACAESVGAMDTLLRATVDWLRTRVQFGRPLAANQALRHRVADLSVACEESRSLTLAAVAALEIADRAADPVARALAASGARAKVGLQARRAAEEAIQLHGGMGVTEEMRVGVYLKRQLALDAMYGPPEWHLRRHAQLRQRQDVAAVARGEPAAAAAVPGAVR
jgi:alkylation response protein AidB-like acyl-CoA dehydrogenase